MGIMEKKRPRWSSQNKLAVSVLLLALCIYLLFRFSVVLPPLILAFVLAYVLSPVTALLQNLLGGRRTLASLLTYFLLLVLIIALLVVIIPPLANQMTGLNLDMQRFLLQVETLLGRQFEFAGQIFDIEALFQQTIGSLQGILEPIFGQTLSLAFEAISSLIWVIFIFIISFYLVKDGPVLREWFERAVPPDYRQDFIRLRGEISHIWGLSFGGNWCWRW